LTFRLVVVHSFPSAIRLEATVPDEVCSFAERWRSGDAANGAQDHTQDDCRGKSTRLHMPSLPPWA
jgi:hypothetical protein